MQKSSSRLESSRLSRVKLSPQLWIFLALFLVMFAFSAMSPLVDDDFVYKFSCVDRSTRITSITQIPASMAAHWRYYNGRLLDHSIVTLLLLLPKTVFNILNGLCVVLLAWMFSLHFRSLRPAASAMLLCCGAFLIWNETPAFGQVYLWLDGTVGYSWGTYLSLLFLLPYAFAWLGREPKQSPWRDGLFLLLSFAAGTYTENGSAAAIFAAVCLTGLLALRERRVRPLFLLGIAAAVAGFIPLITAPGTVSRSAKFAVSTLAANFRSVVSATQTFMFRLFALYAVCLVLCLLCDADRKKILLSAVYILTGLCSLATFIFAAYITDRHFCFTVVFTVLACLLLFSALLERGKKVLPAAVTAAAAVLFTFNFLLGALDIAVVCKKAQEREQIIAEALAAGERNITLEIYPVNSNYSAPTQMMDLDTTDSGWPNDDVARYYGFDSITGALPGSLSENGG